MGNKDGISAYGGGMNNRIAFGGILLLSGCMMAPPISHTGTLVLKPQVIAGQYGNHTVVPFYSQASIHHLLLRLYSVNGGENDLGLQKTLLNAQLDNPIVFSNLKANTAYRIKAYAYLSDDTLISTTDGSSNTDITLTDDDHPTLTNLQVKLIDRPFSGQATSTVVVSPGGYSPVGSESLVIPKLVTTLAGSGAVGYADGVGTAAVLNQPHLLAIDASGMLYLTDFGGRRIRKISPLGVVTTLAGNGLSTSTDGAGTAASFNGPLGIAVDATGSVYVSDQLGNRIRKITSAGVVTTLAGNGTAAYADGTGSAASFNSPYGISVDSHGYVYVCDTGNCRVRKISPSGVVTTLAGSGANDFAEGTGAAAAFSGMTGLGIDAAENLYVSANNRIRKVTPSGVVTTFVGDGSSGFLDGTGTAARISAPRSIAVDLNGNFYIPDTDINRIRKISPLGVVTTLAGNGIASFSEGIGTAASFNYPRGIAVDAYGNIYVADVSNQRIRKLQ